MVSLAQIGQKLIARPLQIMADFFSRDLNFLDSSAGLLVPPEIKPVVFLTYLEQTRQRAILRSRAFHDGDHGIQLTERLKEFLGGEPEDQPCLNFTETVTMAVAEKLKIEGFECDDASYLTWAQGVWDDSRMSTKQADVWEETLVDAEHFILVDWNRAANHGAGEVELIPHPRYVDATLIHRATQGDGYGMAMVYPNGDTSRRPLYAYKRSTETLPDGTRQRQLTVYRPAEVARYYLDPTGGWMPLREVDEATGEFKAWPQPWLNSLGEPLGIPVVHIKNPRLKSEAHNAQRLQKALNKLFLDFLIANDETAFRLWIYAGWDPAELSTSAGSWIGSPKAKKPDFLAEAVDGVDTGPMMAGIEKTIALIAMVTSTPTERLTMSGAVASAQTILAQDSPLRAKVENRQESYGQSTSDAFRVGARIQNAFGPATGSPLNEDARAEPVWKADATVAAITLEIEKKAATQAAKQSVQQTVPNSNQPLPAPANPAN